MNSFSIITQKFVIFAIFLALVGCNDSINASTGSVGTTTLRAEFEGLPPDFPGGPVSHYENQTVLGKEERTYLDFHQWDRLDDGRAGTFDERGYLRRLFAEGLEPSEIERIKENKTRFKLGLFGRYPVRKQSVIDKIKAFYGVVDGSDKLKWAGKPHNVDLFFEYGLCCGEKKALDLTLCELYDFLSKKTVGPMTQSCSELYDFLSNSLPGTTANCWHVQQIFGIVLRHLDHCSEESRKVGHPHCDFQKMVESIKLFFDQKNPITVDQGFIPDSGLGLSSFDLPEFRPIFEKLCRQDHSPEFRKKFADETWGSRHLHGRNLGMVSFGLGILVSAGFGLKRWLEMKSPEYEDLSGHEKREKRKKFDRIVMGVLTGSVLVGFVLYQFLDDRFAVKFLKVKPKL